MATFTSMFFCGSLRILVASVSYLIIRTIYRLKLHPLAKFPGPRLAAITNMYAGSYDLPYATSFCKILPELHDKYGPVIRIRPNQLHIRDLDSFNQVYKPGTHFKKDPEFYSAYVIEGSFFNIHETKMVKPVKDMYQLYFSRAAIQRLEGSIHEKVNKFISILYDRTESCQAVDLTLGYKCLTADVVMGYCYQKTFGALDAPDFHFRLIEDLESLFGTASFTWYFPRLFDIVCRIMVMLPQSFMRRSVKALAATFEISKGCRKRIVTLRAEDLDSMTPSVFQTVLHPDKDKGQWSPSLKELTADALVFFAAGKPSQCLPEPSPAHPASDLGTGTTAHTLTMGTWHMLKNPEMLMILRKELVEAIPDVNSPVILDWITLEKLPYLRAVIKESLRLSFGVPGRLPRVVPENGAVFCGLQIPPGTVISHTAYTYHMSEQYFENAKSFKPERWLGPEARELDNRLVSFSKGSRGCLGINLAHAELFTTFAYVFRKFDLQPFKTTEHDMDWHDCYTPATFGHLKVTVKRVST